MFGKLRSKLAAWLDPEMAANSERYLALHRELYDLKLFFVNVPEIPSAIDWAFGKVATLTSNVPLATVGSLFPSYKRYPSLVQFREVIEAEYKRKTSGNPDVRY